MYILFLGGLWIFYKHWPTYLFNAVVAVFYLKNFICRLELGANKLYSLNNSTIKKKNEITPVQRNYVKLVMLLI